MNIKCSESHCWSFRHLVRLLEEWWPEPASAAKPEICGYEYRFLHNIIMCR